MTKSVPPHTCGQLLSTFNSHFNTLSFRHCPTSISSDDEGVFFTENMAAISGPLSVSGIHNHSHPTSSTSAHPHHCYPIATSSCPSTDPQSVIRTQSLMRPVQAISSTVIQHPNTHTHNTCISFINHTELAYPHHSDSYISLHPQTQLTLLLSKSTSSDRRSSGRVHMLQST